MDFFLKNSCFSGVILPDWGYTAWADMAGLGSIGFRIDQTSQHRIRRAILKFTPRIFLEYF